MPGTRKLGKPTDQRMAMLRQQVTDFLANGRMETTVTRAKEIAPLAENMITLGKKNTLATRRRALLTHFPNVDAIREATMEELLDAVPHIHLLEYSLTVMEGMGLIAHTDLDGPLWNEYECGFDDDQERFRAANHMDPSWRVLRDEFTSEHKDK